MEYSGNTSPAHMLGLEPPFLSPLKFSTNGVFRLSYMVYHYPLCVTRVIAYGIKIFSTNPHLVFNRYYTSCVMISAPRVLC